jgi:hypothetical protein
MDKCERNRVEEDREEKSWVVGQEDRCNQSQAQ